MNVKTKLTSQRLRQLERKATQPKLKRRIRIVRMAKEGHTGSAIASEVGLSRRRVYSWVSRFNLHGVEGLESSPLAIQCSWVAAVALLEIK